MAPVLADIPLRPCGYTDTPLATPLRLADTVHCARHCEVTAWCGVCSSNPMRLNDVFLSRLNDVLLIFAIYTHL